MKADRRVHWYGNPYYPGCHVAVFTQSRVRRIYRPAILTNDPVKLTCARCVKGFSDSGRDI